MKLNFLIEHEFTINWANLVALLVGLLAGMILTVLVYILFVVTQLRKQSLIINYKNDVDVNLIKQDIKDAQNEYLTLIDIKKETDFKDLTSLSFNLMNRIASRFYPNSKNPLGELTLQEIILLDEYLVNKLSDMLDKYGLKQLKKIKANQIINLVNFSNKVMNSKAYQVNKSASKFYSVINYINPVMWVKKLVINPTIDYIIKKIILSLIATVGQETYQVYSKEAFIDEVSDNEMKKVIDAINKIKEDDLDLK